MVCSAGLAPPVWRVPGATSTDVVDVGYPHSGLILPHTPSPRSRLRSAGQHGAGSHSDFGRVTTSKPQTASPPSGERQIRLPGVQRSAKVPRMRVGVKRHSEKLYGGEEEHAKPKRAHR